MVLETMRVYFVVRKERIRFDKDNMRLRRYTIELYRQWSVTLDGGWCTC